MSFRLFGSIGYLEFIEVLIGNEVGFEVLFHKRNAKSWFVMKSELEN